jgi:hypothetical protein
MTLTCNSTLLPPSLPPPLPLHPQGGRNSNQPILREDIFLLKVKAMGRKAGARRYTKPAAEGAEGAAAAAGADPFAKDSHDPWHRSQSQLAQHRGLAALLQPAWKKNPNEKRGPRKC